MIKNMNSKKTTNSQLLTEPKKKNPKQQQKQTKQTPRTGIDSQNWRSHGGLSSGRGKGGNGKEGTRNKKHNW